MSFDKNVFIEAIRGNDREYVVKDKVGIILGRFFLKDLDSKNKKVDVKFKFYKEDNYKLMKETLRKILKVLFAEKDIYKINLFVSDIKNFNAYLDLGFMLEGILSDNVCNNGIQKDEYIMGININDFNDKVKLVQFQLNTERLALRNLTPENTEEMLDYYIRNEEHLRQYEPTRDSSFYTYEGQKEILTESFRQFIDGTSIDLGIFKDEKLIGKIKLSNIVYGILRNAFVGYSIDKEHQGKGYMKEALNTVCSYAFEEMGLHRLEASTLMDNSRSQGVLKACGFNELGISEKYLYINGEWRDHKIFYKVNDDL
ncbi:GNAT family N-acetyltransferase [Clostridium perfringens]|mgnify:FL=1|uniref:Acetyltransferase, GNAT family n=1 Tax=Clostridium perfringens (strain SM101 / Type A) TaxID=289380 RepID=Q0SWY7_CLOPS|nr:GNAT family protein [Clostridium perfringens]ABG86238.1 acetyltransferase, GNAT family [Clostridium perfringens SM101]EJT5917028.1 GNAT family N-acetyltransferase [Clostridium perfringens]EJT6135700.1 GNAT family N-acetyltransferase [Clostridium perfringens]EJT6150990.1 GNAT family N-acetyltransferase [Clostridium perfringens]EJT6156677.1 GNAT family N-acetyltransferase [Clostridium perfringens]